MRKVISAEEIRPSGYSSAAPDHNWWQSCRASEFKERCESMELHDLNGLMSEINGARAVVQATLEDPRDDEHRRKTRWAKGFIDQKRAIVAAIINRKCSGLSGKKKEEHEAHERRRRDLIEKAREDVQRGDFASAINFVLDVFERKET